MPTALTDDRFREEVGTIGDVATVSPDLAAVHALTLLATEIRALRLELRTITHVGDSE